jgi:peptidoglycan/LPS O-acetylase OafA/YrhL
VLRMPELFVGVLLAVWHRSAGSRINSTRAADGVAAVGVAVLIGLFLFVDYSPPWLLRGGYTVVALVTAFTIVGLLQHGRIAALLSWPPLHSLGIISYSLYLVHWPVMSVLTRDRTGMHGVALLAVLLAVSVAIAVALHLLVERPVRRLQTAPLPTIAAGLATAGALTVVSLMVL